MPILSLWGNIIIIELLLIIITTITTSSVGNLLAIIYEYLLCLSLILKITKPGCKFNFPEIAAKRVSHD